MRSLAAFSIVLVASSAAAQGAKPAPAPTASATPAPTSSPAPAPATTPGPVPTPAPAPPATAPADGTSPPTPPPPPAGSPPPGYYVEPGQPAGQPPAKPPEGAIFEPPPPGPIYEPPPPPEPRHVAPRTALFVGARVGWFLPFGNVYARARPDGRTYTLDRVPWSDYASSGVMVEGDIGARLGRHYAVFALWERAELGSGDAEADLHGGQDGASTDFWGLGLRASSNANSLGLLTEVAVGYRQAKTTWQDGTELRFTDGVLEGRIGFGADIRLDPMFSISPMITVGVGAFGEVRRVQPDGSGFSETGVRDEADSHAWLTLGVGGHADLFGAK